MMAIIFNIEKQKVAHILNARTKGKLYSLFKKWLKRKGLCESLFDYYIES